MVWELLWGHFRRVFCKENLKYIWVNSSLEMPIEIYMYIPTVTLCYRYPEGKLWSSAKVSSSLGSIQRTTGLEFHSLVTTSVQFSPVTSLHLPSLASHRKWWCRKKYELWINSKALPQVYLHVCVRHEWMKLKPWM